MKEMGLRDEVKNEGDGVAAMRKKMKEKRLVNRLTIYLLTGNPAVSSANQLLQPRY